MKQDATRLAWAAGFFDGEGCVFISNQRGSRNSRHVLRISVTQKTQESLDLFNEIVGGEGKVYRPLHYQVVFAGIKAKRVLEQILPFLVVKKRQAELAILFQSKVIHGRNTPLTRSEQRERDLLYRQVKRLKK